MRPVRTHWIVAVSVLAGLAAWGMNAPAAIPFEHVVVDTEYWGDCKAVGDLDGDGLPDLVLANQSWLVWYAAPNWRRTLISQTGENYTTDMELGDVDRDGDLDVIVPDGPKGVLRWFENPWPRGDPFQDGWTPHVIGEHGAHAHDVEVADLDGDGDLDVVTRPKGPRIIVWRQETPDRWESRVIPCPSGEGLALGDLDGDGRPDIVVGGRWYKSPSDVIRGEWVAHTFADWPHGDTYPKVGDLNADGRPDIVLTPSEGKFRLSWFEAPPDPTVGPWTEHVMQDPIAFTHSLQLADLDGDGTLDVVTAEMAQSEDPDEVMIFFNGGGGASWTKQVVAATGSHNLRVADLDGDGDLDLYGSNWQNPPVGRVEFWRNRLDPGDPRSLDRWTYLRVDGDRPDRAFGLAMGDLTGDGYGDIVSGPFFYRNPGGDMAAGWARVALPNGVDAMLIVDVDGDALADVIAEKLPAVYWLEETAPDGSAWTATPVATIPPTGHGNGQGYALAQIVPGGRPEILLSSGEGMFALSIPARPEEGHWPTVRIAAESSEEGIGSGDIDGDGDIDVAGPTAKGGVTWWENPGDGSGGWTGHPVGALAHSGDRIAVADIDGDGRLDLVVTEETPKEDASVYWFEAPADPRAGAWTRHRVVTQFTTNNLDVADMDGDGDPDLITAEHRGTRKLQIWENVDGGARWIEHVVDRGKESHLGARVADLDGDGDLEIVSIAWDAYPNLHLWRNDAAHRQTSRPTQ